MAKLTDKLFNRVIEGKFVADSGDELPKELPAVSAVDNGKALVVSGGKWEKGNVPSPQGSIYFVSGYVADVDDNQYQIPFQPYLALSEGETYLPDSIEGFFGIITGNGMDYRFVMRDTEGNLIIYGDLSVSFSYGEITIRALNGTVVATITA